MKNIDSSGDVLKLFLGAVVTAITCLWLGFMLVVWIFS
jgi:hypothetical protein